MTPPQASTPGALVTAALAKKANRLPPSQGLTSERAAQVVGYAAYHPTPHNASAPHPSLTRHLLRCLFPRSIRYEELGPGGSFQLASGGDRVQLEYAASLRSAASTSSASSAASLLSSTASISSLHRLHLLDPRQVRASRPAQQDSGAVPEAAGLPQGGRAQGLGRRRLGSAPFPPPPPSSRPFALAAALAFTTVPSTAVTLRHLLRRHRRYQACAAWSTWTPASPWSSCAAAG